MTKIKVREYTLIDQDPFKGAFCSLSDSSYCGNAVTRVKGHAQVSIYGKSWVHVDFRKFKKFNLER